uniref:Uncharacterized protein n=1 Tax=Rhizophora mucronata TaxID=61149 RepID=A0A2P2JS14_RHIMU
MLSCIFHIKHCFIMYVSAFNTFDVIFSLAQTFKKLVHFFSENENLK